MSYFDELGGEQVIMSASAFGALSPPERSTLVMQLAQQMAPTVLARVGPHEHGVELVGRYGVHALGVYIDGASGALTLRLRPRRRLLAPARVIHGGPQDPSRQRLAELPHGTGELLNRRPESSLRAAPPSRSSPTAAATRTHAVRVGSRTPSAPGP